MPPGPPPTVAVIGASADPLKFGNKSVRAHQKAGYHVFPVHPTAASVEGLMAFPNLAAVPAGRLDRVSVYLPPARTLAFLDELAGRAVGEVWLNPGAYDAAVVARAEQLGLPVRLGCSIVDVGIDPHAL
jgi:hypothetical protein